LLDINNLYLFINKITGRD